MTPNGDQVITVRELLDALGAVQRVQVEHGTLLRVAADDARKLVEYQHEMNGTVRKHAEWIACNANLIVRSAELVDKLNDDVDALVQANVARAEVVKRFEKVAVMVDHHEQVLNEESGEKKQKAKDRALTLWIIGLCCTLGTFAASILMKLLHI